MLFVLVFLTQAKREKKQNKSKFDEKVIFFVLFCSKLLLFCVFCTGKAKKEAALLVILTPAYEARLCTSV